MILAVIALATALLQTPPIEPECPFFFFYTSTGGPFVEISAIDANGVPMFDNECCDDGMTLRILIRDDGLGTEYDWRVLQSPPGGGTGLMTPVGSGSITVYPALGYAELRLPIPSDCDYSWTIQVTDRSGFYPDEQVTLGCGSPGDCF